MKQSVSGCFEIVFSLSRKLPSDSHMITKSPMQKPVIRGKPGSRNAMEKIANEKMCSRIFLRVTIATGSAEGI
jgi:hypothetical protein